MLTAHTYDQVITGLTDAFEHRYRNVPVAPVHMLGLLFARPESPLSKAEVVPNLDYFYHRSGDHIDFYCGGYALGPEPDSQHRRVVGSRGDFWVFNGSAFDSFRQQVEKRTAWRYSGGTDLLLTNARFDRATKKATLDFRTAMLCQLDTMKSDKTITTVEMFFEDIFRFAEGYIGDDPVWAFSDKMGWTQSRGVLKRVISSFLPKSIGEDAERASHFAVRDVSRK